MVKSKILRLGDKIRALRMQRGLTAKELAASLGLKSHSYILEMEQGIKRPSLEVLLTMSLFFKVSTDSLLNDDMHCETCVSNDI